jgi:putative oxidoreductase
MGNTTSMEDVGKLILRITTAGLILIHGITKIFHGISFLGDLAAAHLPFFIAYGVYVGEVVAPLLIIFGLWTRVASLVVVFNMIVATLLDAYPRLFFLESTGAWGFEVEAFYLLTALVIFFLGAGKLSVKGSKGALS